jgi:diguanylate cyclase (GGDEF)-like protein
VLAVCIDIDRFKTVNDDFGHAMGDRVLASVGQAIASRTRQGDLAARYGGEEFLVVVPNASLEVASRIGERYREVVRALRPQEGGPGLVTISVGIAGAEGPEMAQRTSLLARADAALYQAKASGRDRVVVDPLPLTGVKAANETGRR